MVVAKEKWHKNELKKILKTLIAAKLKLCPYHRLGNNQGKVASK